MKKMMSSMFVFFFFSSLFSLAMGFSRTGSFVLRDKLPLRVTIDHGWERDNKIPVFLSFGNLEIGFLVNTRDLSTGTGLESRVSEVLFGTRAISVIIYEQNAMRSRLVTVDDMTVRFRVDSNGMVEIFAGGHRLKLPPLHALFDKIESASPDLYKLTFVGSKVTCHKPLVFMPAGGIIYTAPGSRNTDWMVSASGRKKNER